MAQRRPPARRPFHRLPPAAPRARSNTISAPPAAASGRPPTAAPPGGPSPMARSTAPRSARWRCPNRIPTSSTSAWARPNCAATSCRATASTNPPTPATPGSTWASTTRRPSRASASIPPIPTSSTSPRSAIPTAATPSAASSAPKTAARPGSKILYRDDHAGAVDLCLDPHNPNVLYAAIWDVNRTPWSLTSGGPGSGLFKIHRRRRPLDRDHAQSRPARQGIIGKIGRRRSPAPIPTASTRSSKTTNGGVFVSDDAGATWKQSQRRPQHAAARLLLLAHLRRPQSQRHRLRAQHRLLQIHRRRQDLPHAAHAARRQSRPLDRPQQPARMVNSNDGGGNVSVNGGQTWTGQRIPHGAALSRRRHERHSVSRLRRAAG